MAIVKITRVTLPENVEWDSYLEGGDGDDVEGAVPEDPSAFATIRPVQTYELGASDSTETLDVRGAINLVAVTDGNAKWEVPSEDGSFYDFHVMTSQSQTATSNVGVVAADAMPPYIRLTDTSGSANTVTIYARMA